jgi:hypothetical protein
MAASTIDLGHVTIDIKERLEVEQEQPSYNGIQRVYQQAIVIFGSIQTTVSSSMPSDRHFAAADSYLDKKLPNFWIQNQTDHLGVYIESYFQPLSNLDTWLRRNEIGNYYERLAIILGKLPFKVA